MLAVTGVYGAAATSVAERTRQLGAVLPGGRLFGVAVVCPATLFATSALRWE